jgi:hypothetical protein
MSKPATLQDYSDTLAPHLPPAALPYVAEFLFNNKISLVLSRPRRTKLGDYTFPNPLKRHGHRISINANLDRNTFLWVILHEIAHYQVFVAFGKRLKPHGDEFQAAFAKNLRFFNERHCFPTETVGLISDFYSKLPLRKSLERKLERTFREMAGETAQADGVPLSALAENSFFSIRGRIFKKLDKRRTRCKCLCLNNNRFYLVSLEARVQPVAIEKMK